MDKCDHWKEGNALNTFQRHVNLKETTQINQVWISSDVSPFCQV